MAPEKNKDKIREKDFPYLNTVLMIYVNIEISPNLKINSYQIPAPTDK